MVLKYFLRSGNFWIRGNARLFFPISPMTGEHENIGNCRRYASSLFPSANQTKPTASTRMPTFKRVSKKSQRLADLAHSNWSEEVDETKPPAFRAVLGILENFDSTDRLLSSEECAKLRSDVVHYFDDNGPELAEKYALSADANILQALLSQDRLLSGLSYGKYLASNNLLNPGCVSPISTLLRNQFLRTDLRVEDEKGHRGLTDYLGKELEKVINGFPQFVKDQLNVSVISALACTSEWQRSLAWLNGQLTNDDFSIWLSIINPLIVSALESKKPSIAFDLMELLPRCGSVLDGRVHHAAWNYMVSTAGNNSTNEAIEFLDAFLVTVRRSRSFGLCLPPSVTGHVTELFSSLKPKPFTVSKTKIDHGGKCTSCGQVLEKVSLSSDEFSVMRKEILDRFVKNTDVYRWTNPVELKRFDRTLKQLGPFDVIVDGLNVVHSDIRQIGRGRLQKLIDVLTSVKENPDVPVNRILVLLRPYVKLERYPSMAERIHDLATVFVCGHDSTDDSFLLYGTLVSGPHCYFVTNDFLRPQNEQLSTRTSSLFQIWRRIRQVQFKWNPAGEAWTVWPTDYAIYPQRTGGNYHFPLQNDSDEVGTKFNWKAHETAMRWLCVSGRK